MKIYRFYYSNVLNSIDIKEYECTEKPKSYILESKTYNSRVLKSDVGILQRGRYMWSLSPSKILFIQALILKCEIDVDEANRLFNSLKSQLNNLNKLKENIINEEKDN